VAILSYEERLASGITGDNDSAPDAKTLAEAIDAAIAELSEPTKEAA